MVERRKALRAVKLPSVEVHLATAKWLSRKEGKTEGLIWWRAMERVKLDIVARE
jgi:hypothetical protein